MSNEQPAGTVPVVPAHTFPDPAELIADAYVWHKSSGMCHFGKVCELCDCGVEGATPERAREADQLELDAGRTAVTSLEAAGLLAVTEPVMLRTHTNTQGGDLLNTLVGGFTEVLKRLGYAGTVVAEESAFGGWNLALAARRMTPEERAQ